MKDAFLETNTESGILLRVELDEELGRIERALVAVPLHKVLVALLVFENRAKAAEGDALECVVTALDQVKEDLNTFNVQEVQF